MTLNFKKIKPIGLLLILHAVIVLLAVGLIIKQKGQPKEDKEKIVVISIEGVITMGDNALGRGQSVDALVDSIHHLEEDEDVKAIVLRINSPGGSIGAVQEIYRALKKCRSKGKFIVSSFGDVAASGGYYIACAGDKIVSNPGTLTGSIGVIMQMPNVKGLLDKIGVSFETIKSGSMKDSGSPFRAMTDEERAYLKDVILDAYDQFFEVVKTGRKIDATSLSPLADGRIFSGRMALKNKLVDQMGGLNDAIETAKKLSGLEGKKPVIVYQKEKRGLDRLVRMLSSNSQFQKLQDMALNETKVMYLMQ